MIEQMIEHSDNLKNLKVLTLSKLGMDMKCASFLGECVTKLHNLEQLDISGNNLFSSQLTEFLKIIKGRNNSLKSLNLGFNSANEKSGSVSFGWDKSE